MKRAIGVLTVALMLTTLTACGGNDSGASKTPKVVTLTIFAAASLKSTFTRIGKEFETEHEGVRVTFSFAGSSDLVAQIQQGAPADVFASADARNMDKAVGAKLIDGSPVNFASNTQEIVTPPDNPARITSLADLAKPGVKVVLCAPEVPCGSAAHTIEKSSGVAIKPVSEEASVTDVLNKVATGEADAGLVYVTDVKVAGDKVKGITFPESANAVNTYPIAALAASKNGELARQFVELVTSARGRAILFAAGFAKP